MGRQTHSRALGAGQRRARRRLAPAHPRPHGARLRPRMGRLARGPAAFALAAVRAEQRGEQRATGAQLFRQSAPRQRGDQKAHRPALPDRYARCIRSAASHRPRLRGRRPVAGRRRRAGRRRTHRGHAALRQRDPRPWRAPHPRPARPTKRTISASARRRAGETALLWHDGKWQRPHGARPPRTFSNCRQAGRQQWPTSASVETNGCVYADSACLWPPVPTARSSVRQTAGAERRTPRRPH